MSRGALARATGRSRASASLRSSGPDPGSPRQPLEEQVQAEACPSTTSGALTTCPPRSTQEQYLARVQELVRPAVVRASRPGITGGSRARPPRGSTSSGAPPALVPPLAGHVLEVARQHSSHAPVGLRRQVATAPTARPPSPSRYAPHPAGTRLPQPARTSSTPCSASRAASSSSRRMCRTRLPEVGARLLWAAPDASRRPRVSQVPHRWIGQGPRRVLPLLVPEPEVHEPSGSTSASEEPSSPASRRSSSADLDVPRDRRTRWGGSPTGSGGSAAYALSSASRRSRPGSGRVARCGELGGAQGCRPRRLHRTAEEEGLEEGGAAGRAEPALRHELVGRAEELGSRQLAPQRGVRTRYGVASGSFQLLSAVRMSSLHLSRMGSRNRTVGRCARRVDHQVPQAQRRGGGHRRLRRRRDAEQCPSLVVPHPVGHVLVAGGQDLDRLEQGLARHRPAQRLGGQGGEERTSQRLLRRAGR